jgi:peptidoglycan/xylan/chitin deacetylase (PgdA/CDA1 family)
MGVTRRGLIGAAAAFAGGTVSAYAGEQLSDAINDDRPLRASGYAPATHADRRTAPKHSHTTVQWAVDTTEKLVALTFDDGPRPQWTPEVLDVLDEHHAPATFFLVGQRVREHAKLITKRMTPHEVGNHSWDHRDLARRSFEDVYRNLSRAHDAIADVTGREPALLRPPYGHVGGSTLLAANEMGYGVALWSLQMLESKYTNDPDGLVDYVLEKTTPGAIILAHDTGKKDRLVALRGLPKMITGLRQRGYTLVTASDLISR